MKTPLKLTALAALALSVCSCSKKEDDLVDHLEAVDSIMQDNMDSPKKGVEKLISYFESSGPEALSLTLELGIEVANIEGDGDREERVKEIKEALETPWKNFAGTVEKFGEKVQRDKEARELAEEYGERWDEVGKVMQMAGGSGLRF